MFEKYTECLLGEIALRKAEITDSLGLNTLYIGGGTPSVLPLSCLKKIVDALSGFGPFCEFTIELNPEDVVIKGEEYVKSLVGLGVTRFSMGVQSLDDAVLEQMHRRHNAARARMAYRLLGGGGGVSVGGAGASGESGKGEGGFSGEGVKAGADRSVDIISGWPGMSIESLEKSVDEIISWRPEHISAYQLSIEEGSALAKMISCDLLEEAPDSACAVQYELLCSKLKAAGYKHYEISNWALPGHEAVHNSAYWTRRPYVGLGPGAHSLRLMSDGTQVRSWNSEKLSGWSTEGSEVLSEGEIYEERLMLGLRTANGVPVALLGKASDQNGGSGNGGSSAPNCNDSTLSGSANTGSGCAFSRLEALPNGNVRIAEKDFFIADEIISGLI